MFSQTSHLLGPGTGLGARKNTDFKKGRRLWGCGAQESQTSRRDGIQAIQGSIKVGFWIDAARSCKAVDRSGHASLDKNNHIGQKRAS